MNKIQRYIEALTSIARLPLPVRKINGIEYVDADIADNLRNIAKRALENKEKR